MGRAASTRSPARIRAARRPASERRLEILRTAMRAFAQRGYRETGTADIAGEIGISEPTLYRYFASKRELYLEAVEAGSVEILQRWQEIARDSATPLDALRALGVWYFQELQRDASPVMLRARAEIETDDPEVSARLRESFVATFDLVHGLYRSAREAGLVPPEVDVEARTWLFMSLGALIDRTELMALRDRLDATAIARIVGALAPELVARPGLSPAEDG